MASFQAPEYGYAHQGSGQSVPAPLIVLFERDDTIAVPLLSALRTEGYDVRSARTPVELFDLLGKQSASLVLVDLGLATAARREFWIALDAQRRGRSLQVVTYRNLAPGAPFDLDLEPTPQPLADIDLRGTQDFAQLLAVVRQRLPLGQFPLPAYGQPAPQYGQPVTPPVVSPTYAPPSGIPGQPPAYVAVPYQPNPSPAYGVAPGFGTPPVYGMAPGAFASPASPVSPAYGVAPGGNVSPGALSPWGPTPLAAPVAYGAAPAYPPPYNPAAGYPASNNANNGNFGNFGNLAGQPPSSPFAHPNAENPFAPGSYAAPLAAAPASMQSGMGPDSPFAQPYAINPFNAAVAGEQHTPPSSARDQAPFNPTLPTQSAPKVAPKAPEPPPSPGPFGFGTRDTRYSALGNPFTSSPSAPSAEEPGRWVQPADQSFSDTWTPPDASDHHEASARPAGISENSAYLPVSSLADERAGWDAFGQPGEQSIYDIDAADLADQPTASRNYDRRERVPTLPTSEHGPTTPVPTTRHQPTSTPTETALSSVLLEGALLTESKLDILKGVQQMLSETGKRYKLGELALLFRFLSPDQLLAALLVSRGLVSPQQIAGLGRVKQELAASGMDHDLESLLIMFNILPEEQLRHLRAELS